MTEKELNLRKLFVTLPTRYLGCTTGDDREKRIVDIYNTYLPHPRGYAMEYDKPWCATFTSAMAIMTELDKFIPIEVGCNELMNLGKQKGIWRNKNIVPQIGDIVFFDWLKDDGKGGKKRDGVPDHVEIVEEVGENYIVLIGGNNTDHKCSRQTYLLTDDNILGYICPDYATAAGETPAPISGFPWYGIVQTEVNTRTSPQNLGPLNWCNIEAPTGSPIRHTLKAGEKVKIIGESGNWWQTEITGRYTWTPFIAKTSGGKEIVKRI